MRAQQLTVDLLATKSMKPADLKYCVNVKFLKFSIALEQITGSKAYKDLTIKQVPERLEDQSKTSK